MHAVLDILFSVPAFVVLACVASLAFEWKGDRRNMMESIEKLREYAEQCCPEYEDYDARMIEIADAIEAEIKSRYMLLPVDADGVPIHVGDVMCSAGIREKGHKVIVSAIFEDGFVEYGSDNGLIGPLCQEDWVHVKPRTIEDVLADFADELHSDRTDGMANRVERLTAKYADEIRELMEVGR